MNTSKHESLYHRFPILFFRQSQERRYLGGQLLNHPLTQNGVARPESPESNNDDSNDGILANGDRADTPTSVNQVSNCAPPPPPPFARVMLSQYLEDLSIITQLPVTKLQPPPPLYDIPQYLLPLNSGHVSKSVNILNKTCSNCHQH